MTSNNNRVHLIIQHVTTTDSSVQVAFKKQAIRVRIARRNRELRVYLRFQHIRREISRI